MDNQLVCILRGKWHYTDTGEVGPGPKYGEVVTPIDKIKMDDGTFYLYLSEYPNSGCYQERWFVPLDDFNIDELLEVLEEGVTETA